MPNYYDMSGEPAAASAQPATGADNGPTAEETIGATTGAGRRPKATQIQTATTVLHW